MYKEVENFEHAPRYELPKGMNPVYMPNPHYMTPEEMRELGIKRIR
ncbi:MAG: hypothetical protein ACE5J7_01420 [Candidatus Aenigmatarchaeota archaeon]